jgi:acyl-CoA synthetase (AMP-forming)/AMP-acid ligase II
MSDPVSSAASMAEVLQTRAALAPDTLAFCFLIDGEEEGPRLTYGELDREARAVAATLQDVAAPGDRALLLYAPGLEFIAAFFGCQYAGVVPVPAYPPRLDRPVQGWQALANIAADSQPRVVLTGGPVAPFIHGEIGQVPALGAARVVVTDGLDPTRARQWREPATDPDALALLQYTSGSTAAPRGVMVTHRNLMHNERMIQAAFEHAGPGMGVCWLPNYHDMGLIGGVLQVVYHGASCMLMSPLVLLRWPLRWLQAISRYRADTSGGPNFAYDFCVQRITPEERAGLDLSNWSVAAIGSEPVSPQTLVSFAKAFGPCAFRPESFYPCYGLAEATLFVTGGAKGQRPVLYQVDAVELEQGRALPGAPTSATARTLVGCGHPWAGQGVRIVDPETQTARPDGCVGEIWVAGPSVAPGYWNRPDETDHTFRAFLRDTGEGPFLRTGDLGFVKDGELFVTGRIKDVIVIRGRNHYPQDIECTVQSVHPGLRPGGGAAFEVNGPVAGVSDPGYRLVVVQEVERRCRRLDVPQLLGDIRQAVAERHELQVHDVRLLEYGSLPKTSSGKVQRHLCRAGYERGTLRLWKGVGA